MSSAPPPRDTVPDAADPLADLPRWQRACRRRLEQGRDEYHDRSFELPPAVLAAEIEEELMDVCNWAYILACRVRRIRETIRERGA